MELLRSGMKQADLTRELQGDGRTVYDWKNRTDNNEDLRNRKR